MRFKLNLLTKATAFVNLLNAHDMLRLLVIRERSVYFG